MSIEIKVMTDNSEEIIKELKYRVEVALEAVGLRAETYAKMKCPVDTGLLRNSITHAVAGKPAATQTYHAKYGSNRNKNGKRISATAKGAGTVRFGTYSGTIGNENENAVYVGTNVEYAPYIELGSSKNPNPQPFLKPAVVDHKEEYKRIFQSILKGN